MKLDKRLLQQAKNYANHIRNRQNRDYARRYIYWLKTYAEEPEDHLPHVVKEAIRLQIDTILFDPTMICRR